MTLFRCPLKHLISNIGPAYKLQLSLVYRPMGLSRIQACNSDIEENKCEHKAVKAA